MPQNKERCPSCGRPVPTIFEHVAIDKCEEMTDAEVAHALALEAELKEDDDANNVK